MVCVSGSNDAPGQLDAAACAPIVRVAIGPFDVAHRRRRENRAEPVARDQLHRFGAKLGGEVDQVINRETLAIVRAAAWSETAASASTTRAVCRPLAPDVPRSARPVRPFLD